MDLLQTLWGLNEKRCEFQGQISLHLQLCPEKYNRLAFQMRHFDTKCTAFLKKQCSWPSGHLWQPWVREGSEGWPLFGSLLSESSLQTQGVLHLGAYAQPLLSSEKPLSQDFLWINECQRPVVDLYILVNYRVCFKPPWEHNAQSRNDRWPVLTDTCTHLGCGRAFRCTRRLGSWKACLSFIFRWW